MTDQDGVSGGGWKERVATAFTARWPGSRAVLRGLADLILPPVAHDSREATAAAGPDAWSRVAFLEAPVCDGYGAAFEYDGGAFAPTASPPVSPSPTPSAGRARPASMTSIRAA